MVDEIIAIFIGFVVAFGILIKIFEG